MKIIKKKKKIKVDNNNTKDVNKKDETSVQKEADKREEIKEEIKEDII